VPFVQELSVAPGLLDMRQVFVVTNALAFFPVVTKKKSFFQHFNSDGRPENREEGGRLIKF
jgi:hypothetical protein